jgi:hypothetical protein
VTRAPDYFDNGTGRGSSSSTYTIKATGKIDDRGHSRDTGGTGVYRGVTGTGTTTGSNNPHGKFWIYSVRGTVVLP